MVKKGKLQKIIIMSGPSTLTIWRTAQEGIGFVQYYCCAPINFLEGWMYSLIMIILVSM